MPIERIKLDAKAPDRAETLRVAKALSDGALVAIPTETVYGVAANAAIGDSVERLRRIKGRPAEQPFTVHIGAKRDCDAYVPAMSAMGRRFVKKGWPGPLTLIFQVPDPTEAEIHRRLSPAGLAAAYVGNSVGIRLPADPVAAAILAATNAPIIASSANLTGVPAPTTADEVAAGLGDSVDLLVDAGPTRYRKGSTVVRLNGTGYEVIRTGVYDARTVARLSTVNILFVCTGNTCRSPMAAAIFRKMAAERLDCPESELSNRGVIIQSSGTYGGGGGRASEAAIEVCRRRGIDIGDHRSRGLSLELVNPADHIFTMSRQHLATVRSLAPGAELKTALLDPDGDIEDPIGGTTEDYEHAARTITAALERRIDEVPL